MEMKTCNTCNKERKANDVMPNGKCRFCAMQEGRQRAVGRKLANKYGRVPQPVVPKTVGIESSWGFKHIPELKDLQSTRLVLPPGWTQSQAMEVRARLIHEINTWAKGSFMVGEEES